MAVKDVTYAPELTRAALRFKNGQFVAKMVLPPEPQTDEDGIFMKELSTLPFTSLTNLQRGDFAIAQDISEGTDSDTYKLEGWALRRFISDRERRRAKGGFATWLSLVGLRLQGLLDLRYEVATAALLFNSSNITNNEDEAAAPWSSDSTDVLGAIQNARDDVDMLSPLNAAVCNDAVYNMLRKHPQLLSLMDTSRSKQSKVGRLSHDDVKDALELEFLFVSDAKVKSAAGVFTRIWGNDFLMCHVDPTNSYSVPDLGKSFVLNAPGYSNGARGVKYRDPNNRGGGGDWHEMENMIDPVLMSPGNAAYLFENVKA